MNFETFKNITLHPDVAKAVDSLFDLGAGVPIIPDEETPKKEVDSLEKRHLENKVELCLRIIQGLLPEANEKFQEKEATKIMFLEDVSLKALAKILGAPSGPKSRYDMAKE